MDDPTRAPYPPPPTSWSPPAAPPPIRYAPIPSIPLGGYPGGATPPPYPTGPPVAGQAPTGATVLTIVGTRPLPRQRWGAAIAILGAAGIAAGSFLPWLSADVEGLGTRMGNGWTNIVGDTSWGPLLLLLALVAAVAVAPTLADVRSPAAVVFAAAAVGLAGVVVAGQVVDIARSHAGAVVELRYGMVVLIVATAVAAIGVGLAALGAPAAKVAASRAVGAVG